MKKRYLITVVLILAIALVAGAVTYSPTPMPKAQFFDNSGRPLSGGWIYTYVPGTTTFQTTYSDAAGLIPNSNPVHLDSAGRASIFLNGYYDISVFTSAGVQLYSASNIGNPSGSSASPLSQWNPTGFTPTRTGNTTFTVAGDKSTTFSTGIRIKSDNTGGVIYSTVVSAVFGGVNTTITVINDTGTLDAGMSSVSTSILTPVSNGIPIVPVVVKTGNYTFTSADVGKIFVFSSLSTTATATLPAASSVPSGAMLTTKNTSTWPVIIGATVDGVTNPVLQPYEQMIFTSYTTSWGGLDIVAKYIMDNTGSMRTASTVTAPNVIPITGSNGILPTSFFVSGLMTAETTTVCIGAITVTNSNTGILSNFSLGNLTVGDRFLLFGSLKGTKGGVAGMLFTSINQPSGSGAIKFDGWNTTNISDSRFCDLSADCYVHFAGYGQVTSSGTVVLAMYGNSQGSFFTITGTASMTVIFLKKQ